VVDLEISGGSAIREPEYIVSGSRGGLVCEGGTLKLRYLDPKRKLRLRTASRETPGTTFGTPDKLEWIEKEIPVKPRPGGMAAIWDHLHAALRKGKPFPITLGEAVAVTEIVSLVKKGTPFA